ncbi:GNAT family N-acetyltransferase [uncultured Demequina sp.]|uniref:GNAT family N-acetyltransferase n=1 Tax=uncultured Demequina sp. TaxID=693499 RepID=UPI0025EACE97|nr:GNAT family N-acetyltransferase [uncultured Demequina sp.]
MRIEPADLDAPDVAALLAEHLEEMHASSPACSVHALPLAALRADHVTAWTARSDAGALLGIGALAELDREHGEVKSMRTSTAARGQGVAASVLTHLLDEARRRRYTRVSLETGSQEIFAPAHRLYARFGFEPCGPFAGYGEDPASAFYTLTLDADPATGPR